MSADPAVIGGSLRVGLTYLHSAVEQLARPDAVQSHVAIVDAIYGGYERVRHAHAAVDLAISKNTLFRDPLLEWQSQRIRASRSHILAAHTDASSLSRYAGAVSRPEVQRAIDELNAAIGMIEAVLETMP